jgi:2-dehydropantoate 2-reductase
MSDPHIAVLGAGANGASLGADLIRAGLDVTLVEQWPAHVQKMRSDGLTIETPDETIRVEPTVIHLCEVAELKRPFDIVLMLMKAYDSQWAAQLIAPHLADDGLMVGVQNGMTAGVIQEVVGPKRTVGAVIECSSTMDEPAVVHRHTPVSKSWFATGVLAGGPSRDREDQVAALLRHSGTVDHFDDIESAKWMKLVSNSTLLVTSAILGLPMLDALAMPGYREVMVAAGNEALAVGGALGHQVLPIFGLTASEIADRSRIVDVMTDKLFAGFVVPGATTTVLQDWRRGPGRHSEVDDINGLVVERGSEAGVQTPTNSVVTELAHRIERGELTPRPQNLDLMTAPLA